MGWDGMGWDGTVKDTQPGSLGGAWEALEHFEPAVASDGTPVRSTDGSWMRYR